MNQERLAKALGWSPSAISNFVTGRRMPQRDHVEKMDAALGADGLLLGRWTADRKRAAEPSWMRSLVEVEDRAVELRVVQPTLLPIVLQSPDYSRVVLRLGRPLNSPEDIEVEVERRAVRAAHLMRPEGPRISVLITEAVCEDARDIDAGVIGHLRKLAESMCLQVIPRGVHVAAATGAFRTITFKDRLPLVFAESATGGSLVDHPELVARFQAAMNSLQAWAMSPVQTSAYLKELDT
jgi:transcriptional regulator with XRE-family HTH domain